MFLKPIMLAGLGAAVLPLFLHLLSKARYRTVDCGTMMFLEVGIAHRGQHARLKQTAMLLLRMSVVALLALTMARPVLRKSSAASGEEARVHAIIIFDRSASMAFEENTRPRMAAAKQAAIHVLSNLRRGDEVSLILTGDPVDPGQAQPTSDLQALAARIGSLAPSHGRANIVTALEQARQALLREPGVTHELYVICDRQAISWDNVNDPFCANWQQTAEQLASPLRSFVIPVGGEEADNVTIESIRFPGPPAVKGTPAQVEVRVRNFGPVPRSDLPLSLLVNGTEFTQTSVNLQPDSAGVASAWVQFAASGSQVLSAKLSSSGLKSDDECDRAVDVLEPARVLIISGEARSAAERTSADFIRLALAPHEVAGEAGVDPAVVRIIGTDDWWGISPDRDDVIILADTGKLSDDQIRQLEQFVYSGGGLLIAPGNLADVAGLNNDLFRDGEGFLPASFKPPGSDAVATTLKQVEAQHPLFAFLQDRAGQLPDAPIAKMLEMDDRGGDARVLASCANGKPFLIERPYGRGRVLMFTTSLSPAWNGLANTSFYLPLLQSCARYLAGANLPDRNLKPGEPIELSFDHQPAAAFAFVTLPNTQQRRVPAIQSGQRWTIRFNETGQPGRYVLALRGASPASYVVSSPRGDSDPAPLSEQRWEWLAKSLNLRRLDPDNNAMASSIKAERTGRELHLPLLACVIVLSLGEMALGRIWSSQL